MRLATATWLALALAASACGEDAKRDRCRDLVATYADALPAARACTEGEICSAGRPQVYLDWSIEGLGCSTLVTDGGAASLDVILAELDAAGCPRLALPCPAVALTPSACVNGSCP